MTPALSLNPAAAAPAAPGTAAGRAAAGEAGAASFTDTLRAETPAAAALEPANDPTASAEAADPATAEAAAAADPAAVPAGAGGKPAPRPATTRAASSPATAAQAAAEPTTGEAPAGEGPAATRRGPGEAAAPSGAAVASEATQPLLAAPEALLQWLDHLKAFSPPPTEAGAAVLAGANPSPGGPTLLTTRALAAADTLGAAAGLLPASSGAALAPLMAEALAASLPEAAPAATAATTPTSPAASPSLLAALTAPSTAAAAPSLTTPSATPLPVAMDQGDWPQQMGEQIQWRLGAGLQEARIEISPRELGAVDVRLSIDDNGLRLHLSAAQAQTRELLQAELPRLRDALQQGGLQLSDAQVGREAPGRQSGQQGGQPQAGGTARGRGVAEGESTSVAALAGGWRARRGLLDDYA